MTSKTNTLDASGKQIKTPGWFSWRHKTSGPHVEATARYLASHGSESRRLAAADRSSRPRTQQREADLRTIYRGSK